MGKGLRERIISPIVSSKNDNKNPHIVGGFKTAAGRKSLGKEKDAQLCEWGRLSQS